MVGLRTFVYEITWVRVRFGINCTSVQIWHLKLPEATPSAIFAKTVHECNLYQMARVAMLFHVNLIDENVRNQIYSMHQVVVRKRVL